MVTPVQQEPDHGSLATRLRARIQREGPISFYEWMQTALYDPAEGYYCRSDRARWGRGGDYRTAPESSSLFAATLARYFASLYAELGSPAHFTIIEAGAGSGEFARGVLGWLRTGDPNAFAATKYLIDEVSPDARQRIQAWAGYFGDRVEFATMQQVVEPVPGIVFSNELLDAFPVRRVRARSGRWHELCVALDHAGEFSWVDAELKNKRVAEYLKDAELSDGQIVEVNLDAEDWINRAAATLEKGFVITVDYGAGRDDLLRAPHRRDGTLRGFRGHRLVNDVLANPGGQDLTTTIDWTQIKNAGKRAGLETIRFERLDRFLVDQGLLAELERVSAELDETEALKLRTSAREMIMPNGLAASFQVLVQRK